jgi:DNA-binding NtrC family response regulator
MQPGPRRALIVTDVSLVRWALSSAFGHAGFLAVSAQTADAALDTLRTVGGMDVVVMSLSMAPVEVGEVVQGLGAEWPGIPLILLAAEPDTPVGQRPEAAVLLQLPFSVDDVVAAAEKLAPAGVDGVPPVGGIPPQTGIGPA